MLRAALILSLLIGFTMVAHAQETPQPTHECLQFDAPYAGRAIVDLATGKTLGGHRNAALDADPPDDRTRPLTVISPDRAHAATFYVTQTGRFRLGLYPAYHIDSPIHFDTEADDGFDDYDLIWSPYSQWLSFLSHRGDDGLYLSVVDPDGHVRQSRLISTRLEDSVSSFGWSADERYLAVSVSDSFGGPLRKLQIWSAPDLKLVRTIKPANAIGQVRAFMSDDDSPDKIAWSPQGTTLAYMIYQDNGMDEQLTLNLYAPDIDQLTTQVLPDVRNSYGSRMAWSADGQYVAAITIDDTDSRIGRVDVFGIDGSARSEVSDSVLPFLIPGAGPGFPQTIWSAAQHRLFFVERLPGKSDALGALIAYNPEAGERVTVQPAIAMSPMTVFGNKYLLARAPKDGLDVAAEDATPPARVDASLVVVDTGTLQQITVPALRQQARLFQPYGSFSEQSGWLMISEDELPTWAVNPRDGTTVALYTDAELNRPSSEWPFYLPIPGSDFVAAAENLPERKLRLSIRSLRDATRHPLDATFSWPIGGLAILPDASRVAVLSGTGEQGMLQIFDGSGALMQTLEPPERASDTFSFISC